MLSDLTIGDLVCYTVDNLEKEKRIGIVIKISHVTKLTPSPIDIKILWTDGGTSWCFGEAVTILSSAKKSISNTKN